MQSYIMNPRNTTFFIQLNMEKKKSLRKIILIGSSKCGKTSLIKRFIDNSFTLQHIPTVEDCHTRDYTYRGHNLKLDIVDVCGGIQCEHMRDFHIKTADLIMLVYEVENIKSVNDAYDLYNTIRQVREDRMPIILVGTKIDLKRGSLPPEDFQHSDEISQVLNQIQGAKHVLTSAKYNMHIKEAFQQGLDDIVRKLHTYSMAEKQGNLCFHKKEKHPLCTIL